MNRKSVRLTVSVYFIFIIALLILLSFYVKPVEIPDTLRGTSADPSTFLTEQEIENASKYARIRDLLYFLNTPFQWLVLIIGLLSGFFTRMKEQIQRFVKQRLVSGFTFVITLFFILQLAEFPFAVASYTLAKSIGTSNMSFTFWLSDYVKSVGISFVLNLPILFLVYFFISKSPKKWWLWVSACIAPIMFFMIYIQPVVIDPMFNDFTPLRESETKREILDLASKANIPTNQVYEVNMSERTDLINAYVTGIGSNTRIVIWDTTIEKMSINEIKFIMAHEMGHFVMKHVFWGSCLAIVGTMVIIYFIHVLSRYMINRWGKQLHISSLSSISSLPLLLLLLSILSFMTTPFETYVSRGSERAADTYALQLTNNPESAISGFKKLAQNGKSEINPPTFIKWWRYTHPSMVERLQHFDEYNKQ